MIPQPKLTWQERQSDSPLIESIWTTTALVKTQRTVIADPCVCLALVKTGGVTQVVLSGPKTKPWHVVLTAGYSCTSIRLKPGVFIKGFLAKTLTNNSFAFPADAQGRFWFRGAHLQFPPFTKGEALVEQLLSLGHIGYKTPIDSPRQAADHLSVRGHARHMQRVTGLSPYQLYQLQRAHQALRLLKQGMPAVDVASELSFVDQSHLIRASRQFLGHTPKKLLNLPQTP